MPCGCRVEHRGELELGQRIKWSFEGEKEAKEIFPFSIEWSWALVSLMKVTFDGLQGSSSTRGCQLRRY